MANTEKISTNQRGAKHRHYYRNCQGIGDYAFDIRAEGGYIVCEPSIFQGKEYKFENPELPIIDTKRIKKNCHPVITPKPTLLGRR